MRTTTDPLVQERRERMYGHPSSVAHREAARPSPDSAEKQLRLRQADEKAQKLAEQAHKRFELRREQERENVTQSRQGVPFPAEANLKRHELARRKLEDEQARD